MPTKAFFVDMLTRDIELERSILDLVDNSIDGAKRLRPGTPLNFKGLFVNIKVSASQFEISDNCGGFEIVTARDYAFRFGRPKSAKSTPFSLGQFGVGMKRALFKFGRQFEVSSATASEEWSVNVDVDEWEKSEDWHFDFATANTGLSVPKAERGTRIVVTRIREEVASKFSSERFETVLLDALRTHQRQFIASGLEVALNGRHLTAVDLNLMVGADLAPAVEEFYDEPPGKKKLYTKIVCGVGDSKPAEAGWYVVCNGRVVLAADRSETTGWGRVSEQPAEIPKYHNQFACFRGVIYFDCEDAGRLPWNTTKDGISADSPVWRTAFEAMVTNARAVINFLNELDREIDQHGKDGPLQRAVSQATRTAVDTLTTQSPLKTPDPTKRPPPKRTQISYSKRTDQIELLMEVLEVNSAKAVGEKTFDMIYRDQKGK